MDPGKDMRYPGSKVEPSHFLLTDCMGVALPQVDQPDTATNQKHVYPCGEIADLRSREQ